MRSLQAQISLHATVVVFGFTGVLGKLITLSAVPLVFWRTLIGAAGLYLWMLLRKGQRPILSPKERLGIIGTGLLVAIHWVTFFGAIKASTVSLALAVMATVPMFVAFIEPLIKRRRLDLREVFLGLLAVGGLWWMYRVDVDYGYGMVLALVSAFCAALFGTLNSVWGKSVTSLAVSRIELISASVSLACWMAISGQWDGVVPSASDAGWLLLLGLVATSLAFAITVEVMKVLSPFTVAMAINLEPIYAIVLAIFIFGEEEIMPPGFYAGAAILISTVFLDAWLKRKRNVNRSAPVSRG
ncbi:MAG: DMT family transporter [Flavobacteriales bacterium]|nr:DMT family transporter [Flavobacteriales bacterium]